MRELESRKRAPLYQKKQEEELRVANEKAAEAEVRAQEAELRAKELKASRGGGGGGPRGALLDGPSLRASMHPVICRHA